jgi:hypothetical protein
MARRHRARNWDAAGESARWRNSGAASEAFRLAKQGQHHPDPQVAEAAYRWAQEELRMPRWLYPVSFVLVLLVSVVAGPEDVSEVFDRRRAKRILRLGPPPDLV